MSKILPFYILAKAAFSLRRANGSDFYFAGNGSEFPEYNGFNTKLVREAGVGLHPATHVCFYVINMNPAEPETILTIMNLVKSQSEQAAQEYRVFTND